MCAFHAFFCNLWECNGLLYSKLYHKFNFINQQGERHIKHNEPRCLAVMGRSVPIRRRLVHTPTLYNDKIRFDMYL